MLKWIFSLIFSFAFMHLTSAVETPNLIAISHEGRVIPFEVYAKLKLKEIYGKETLSKNDLKLFPFESNLASDFLKYLFLYGSKDLDDAPLFSIHYAEVKKALHLNLKQSNFSYHELEEAIFKTETSNIQFLKLIIPYLYGIQQQNLLTPKRREELKSLQPHLFVALHGNDLIIEETPKNQLTSFLKNGMLIKNEIKSNLQEIKTSLKPYAEEALNLLSKMNQYSVLNHFSKNQNEAYVLLLNQLKEKNLSTKEISLELEANFPIRERIKNSGSLLIALPMKKSDIWVPIDALALQVFDLKNNSLKPIENFTVYNDQTFKKIQQAYLKLKKEMTQKNQDLDLKNFDLLGQSLVTAYENELANQPIKHVHLKTLYYPSINQLKAEIFYYNFPFIKFSLLFYFLAFIGFIFAKTLENKKIEITALFLLTIGFMIHTSILILRSYILGRPPVSNMIETVIYVPWVAMLVSLLYYLYVKNRHLLIASTFTSFSLLLILDSTAMHMELENVQPVLDSSYWLIVHVLLIVASYGVFILSGILGQIYLIHSFLHQDETDQMKFLSKFILQTMYLGLFLLIPGTLLGGVWAAESWGRFWDWDPKESWAFISSAIYLLFVHAYRFHKIGSFGLAIGSVIGLMAISFTWYGVNYILGTGLHSYGFGTAKDIYYYLFIFFEISFLIIISKIHQKRLEIKRKKMV